MFDGNSPSSEMSHLTELLIVSILLYMTKKVREYLLGDPAWVDVLCCFVKGFKDSCTYTLIHCCVVLKYN